MSFAKFVELLDRSSLYLARIDCFEDGFEGAFPKKTLKLEEAYRRLLMEGLNKGSGDHSVPFWSIFREKTFVNCWHMSPYESEAMWKLYGHVQEAIGIQTTALDLAKAIDRKNGIAIGQVFYVDFDSEIGFPPNPTRREPFFYKRKAFEHEKEVRVLIQDLLEASSVALNEPTHGRHLGVDLATLVKGVVVAPKAPEWFLRLAKSILKRYKLDPSMASRSALDNSRTFPT